MSAAIGQHLLADLHGVVPALLSDATRVESALREAARAAGATVLFGHVHPFGDGLGVTGVLLLMESHISIHTWPEHGFAAVDVFMCGDARPELALASLAASFTPARCIRRLVPRGQPPSP
ncbi:adenosylmethionine decarboxylase [Jeongeupia chitinilytica]|uniref:S-adenosylmethionine decarboxylase proenzyme n=1 Tax=Jeongeupia chitinilytica TaxID=1041641 RepID=A0ABQ3H2X4_9NEIS|nr:adenosylmethionine decarboxylase [Jeongeupia chitinilytica]GHD67655.1 hypothetical protein GCM10007350_31650 [Jeongeupia chitinilytica]